MNITWSANLSSVSKGSKLFEPFDMKLYETKLKEFYDLPSTEKAKYKGADDYVVKNGGPQLCPLNYNYKKIYEETSKRLENGSVPEVLLIDFYMQNKLIDDLLCSLENEKHIREIYPKKKLMVKGNGGTSSPIKSIICFPIYFPFVYLHFYLAFREELIVLQHFQVLIQSFIEILREELHHL